MDTDANADRFVSTQVESSRLFFLEDGSDGFEVVFGGFERCRGDYRIDRADFPWYVLEFVGTGSGKLRLGGNLETLGQGSWFFYGPGIPHRIDADPDTPLGKYFVGFTGPAVESFLGAAGISPGASGRIRKVEPVRRTFDLLIERGIRRSDSAAAICSLITRQLLLMCRDDVGEADDGGSPAFAAYEKVRGYIERNFEELTTLEGIARACGYEAAYICRLFSRYHDESPYRYLLRLRMEKAAQLLLEQGASVKSVAAAMGYKDAFHFSRVFKSVHQVPPSRFRHSGHPQWPGN